MPCKQGQTVHRRKAGDNKRKRRTFKITVRKIRKINSRKENRTDRGNWNVNQLGLNACMLAPTPGRSWYPGDGEKKVCIMTQIYFFKFTKTMFNAKTVMMIYQKVRKLMVFL